MLDEDEKKKEEAGAAASGDAAAAEPEESGESSAAEDADAANRRWYVVRVQSGREEQVRDGLLRRVNTAGLAGKISQVMVPTEKVTEIRSGRKAVRERKKYPGYIMIEMQQDKDAWFLVRETPGIGDFLGLKEPIPMAEHEVQKMLVEQSGAEDEKPQIKIDFQKGDSVRVKEGAFENFDGLVEEINPQKGSIVITITIFGRPTRVDLEYWQVEKV